MKKIIASLFLFLEVLFADAKGTAKKLHVISATSQQFSGGAAGSPSGIRYILKFIAPASSNNLKIDKLWIGTVYYEVSAFNQASGNSTFSKKDTIVVIARKFNPNPKQLNNQTEPEMAKQIAAPCEYKGQALFAYKYFNKRKYLTIEKFILLPRENYP